MARGDLQHPIRDKGDTRHNLAAVGSDPSEEHNVPNIILGLEDG
jgi:hypothetical protein